MDSAACSSDELTHRATRRSFFSFSRRVVLTILPLLFFFQSYPHAALKLGIEPT